METIASLGGASSFMLSGDHPKSARGFPGCGAVRGELDPSPGRIARAEDRRAAAACAATCALRAQEPEPIPELRVATLQGAITSDGRLDEPDWTGEPATDAFLTIDSVEGATPNRWILLRVRADSEALYLGSRCFDPTPAGIVAHSRRARRELGRAMGSEGGGLGASPRTMHR